jgi:hypothetical protein
MHLNIDSHRPEGFYRFDAFFPEFTPGIDVRKTRRREVEEPTPEELDRRPRLELFRYDVRRVARLAQLRTQRENKIQPTRHEAMELRKTLARLRPELVRLSRLDATVDLAARMSGVLRPKPGEPATSSIAVILTQVLDALGAPMRSEDDKQECYLLQWLRELDRYEVVPSLPSRRTERTALARHLTEQAIALHELRLSKRPPASRQHWLGQFIAALWRDLQQPFPDKVSDLDEYFGKKIQDALKRV